LKGGADGGEKYCPREDYHRQQYCCGGFDAVKSQEFDECELPDAEVGDGDGHSAEDIDHRRLPDERHCGDINCRRSGREDEARKAEDGVEQVDGQDFQMEF